MMAFFAAILATVAFVVVMNGFAAGVAAAQHLWPSGRKRGARVFIAVAWAALAAVGWAIPLMPAMNSAGAGPSVYRLVAMGSLFAVIMIVSLPGALVMSRKLERQTNLISAFA